MASSNVRSALIGKIVPAAPAPHVIERPRITAGLMQVPRRRVTALIAGPGFGKTTALTTWASERNCAWYTVTAGDRDPTMLARGLVASLALRVPGVLDTLGLALEGGRGPETLTADLAVSFIPELAGVLHTGLRSHVVLVLDDLHELAESTASVCLVADLCHLAPSRLHLVIASRTDLPFPVDRLRLHGQLHILAADSLGFDDGETAELLVRVGDETMRPHAPTVQRLTGGWPAAVRLVAEAVATAADHDRVLANLVCSGGVANLVEDLLDSDVSSQRTAGLVELLRAGAAVDRFTAPLLQALGVAQAAAVLTAARRRGIHISEAAPDGWFALTPVSREFALARLVGDGDELARIRRAAARWHAERGDMATALGYLCQAGDGPAIAGLLEAHGAALLAAGHAAVVTEALPRVPASLRSAAIDLVESEACQVQGDWDGAVRRLSRLIPGGGPAPAAAAWRLGLIYHMRGEPGRALGLYRRGYDDSAGSADDRALAAAWGASAAWLAGDAETCRDLADKAADLAEATQDSRALAATHTALALLAALDGDPRSNDMHYLRALDHAERAADVLQIIRIRTNRGSRFLEEGYYPEAVAELDTAIGLADLAGYGSLRALAQLNRGEAVRRMGRLDDAARDLHAALATQQRFGSRMAAYALTGLGSVHADRGNLSLARAAYEEAVALAEPADDLQGLVPALCGLALTLAAEDPPAARRAVDRALASGTNLAEVGAHLAAGWLALRRGDPDEVRGHALAAARTARRRRDRAGVAESLELRAAVEADPVQRRALLAEAEAMWAALGCPLPLARTRIALLRVDPAAAVSAAEIERICRELGARALAAEAAALRSRQAEHAPAVGIRTLGGFQVLRRNVPVPRTAWQSRKARDLLKILVSRRGVAVPRELLCHLLWPGVDPGKASNRLSVAISTLRSVLDPGRELPADYYVASGDGAVWLRRDRVDIDIESFLQQASRALSKVDIDDLATAEAAYSGDFCEEDRYADWPTELREEARATYVAVARAIAQWHAANRKPEMAVRYLFRLLACEPYDEQAHLMLVEELDAAGRHGDARRMYRSYAERMGELDVEPAPYPDRQLAAWRG